MSPPVDLRRLRATLGAPPLARVLEALRKRVEQGRPLTGRLSLPEPSDAERDAIDELLGRPLTRGTLLHLDLGLLAESLSIPDICADLPSAVEALCGPVINRRAAAQEEEGAWAALWEEARGLFASWPVLAPWIQELEDGGILRRLSANNVERAALLLRELTGIVRAWPARGEPLAAFAARLLGDAHALDPGSARATLAVRAAARLGAIPLEDDAEGRRDAWACVGVMNDELSVPALVFNLWVPDETPLGRLLRLACAEAEPLHLSLRLLLRSPLAAGGSLSRLEVFVCENPTIVALAVAELGARCAPLVCVNGQFATPALVLLRQLHTAGAQLRYHGDFDPGGLAIARRVFAETGATPWRFSAEDYVAAPKGKPFTGDLGSTPWSPSLSERMQAEMRAVHEEAVFPTLGADLAMSGRQYSRAFTGGQL